MVSQTLYLFNPEHDLALASGEENYMAPASARRMAEELALLPMWYAEEGSCVLAPSAYNLDFLHRMNGLLGVGVGLLTEPELATTSIKEIHPWGWDKSLCRRLLAAGVEESCLPSAAELALYRIHSHRLQAVEVLSLLRGENLLCGESYYLQTPDEWQRFVESQDSCLLKAPLSGSGKGLNWCKGVLTPSISGWCARVAATQGGVIGEPIYNRIADFAMEFWSDGKGGVTFVGYSLFRTGRSGMYEGNRLFTNEAICRYLCQYVPLEVLTALQRRLSLLLSERIGAFYKGYLGVDMMVCRFSSADGEPYRIHPCVEINLRMNMGVLSRVFCDRYVHPGSSGSFGIDYNPSEGAVLQKHRQWSETYPLVVREGKIISGYLPLVPVHKKNSYWAWALLACTEE